MCAASFAGAQEAPKRQFTARELFYSAVQAPATAAPAAPAAPAKAPAKATPAPKKAAPTAPQAARNETRPPAPAPPPARIEGANLPGGARIVAAVAAAPPSAPAPASGAPALGLRYTILKRSGDSMVEVSSDTIFHAGDRIQFSVQTNGPGYLYIISQGSSGTWKPMFPSTEVEDGNNHVDGWHAYTMPPKSRILFDEQTGIEKVFIVLSRQPEPDLEKMIYSLQGGPPKPETKAAPKHLLLAANLNIDNATVGRLRTTYARDLIIEKVDENSPGEKKEKAVYVVNPTGSSDSRVVADLQLVHQ
jgi:hypothetical protein